MICPTRRGKMAAILRHLGNGNYHEITAEEARCEKLAAETIHSELNEADEANLLEEEDMHVFDSRPLVDPLELVSCNACRKPVKASQYVAHAARCKLIKSTEEKMAEPDICSGHKKPPRKGRKKMQTSHDYQASTVGELSESLEGEEDAVSESNADEQTSFSSNGRGRLQRRPTVDLGVATRHLGKEEQRLNPNPCRQQALCDGPTPLATKIYHFQGSRRLRSALGQLYMEAVNGCQARDLSSRRQVNDPRQQGS
ncbi:uncharacterized protein LOC144710441 isoform X3 [Wolffia australiana]